MSTQPPSITEFNEAERRFRLDLPRLLETPDKLGKWVLYGSIGLVAEKTEEESLYREYGSQIGTRYFLARVQPDPPDAEITANWFVSISKSEMRQTDKNCR